MTKKEMKQLRRIIEKVASKRKEIGLNFKEENFGNDSYVNYLFVWCTNSAYRHELNALMMAVNNLGFCSCFQKVDEGYNIVWEAF